MNDVVLKSILLVLLFLLTVFFGLLPIKIMEYLNDQQSQPLLGHTKRPWPFQLISYTTSFAGGVFLGVIFVDLLPDTFEYWEALQKLGYWKVNYPLVELLVLVGFVAVYFVEEMSVVILDVHSHGHDQTLITHNPDIFLSQVASDRTSSSSSLADDRKISKCEIHGEEIHPAMSAVERRRVIIQSITFIVALIFHSIIEGFAFGVQTSIDTVISLFFGIVVHKCVVTFSVGMRLIRCHPENVYFVVCLILVYSLSSPVFGSLGTALAGANFDSVLKNKLSLVLTSLSMGTFLYIAFFEMLAPEKTNNKHSFFNMAATFVGLAVISGTILLA